MFDKQDLRFDSDELSGRWPVWTEDTVEVISRAVMSGRWSRISHEAWDRGYVADIEKRLAQFLNVKWVIGVTSGSVALELALEALELGGGDQVLVPAATFQGVIMVLIRKGIIPVFVDSEVNSVNMSMEALKRATTSEAKGLLVVHMAGIPLNMTEIMSFCRDKDLPVIEDCAHGLGSEIGGRRIGTFGDIGCLSFQQGKLLTCGEGGAVVTNSDDLAGKLYSLQNFFHSKNAPGSGELRMATNARMHEFCGALLLDQFSRFEEQISRRQENHRYLCKLLGEDSPLQPHPLPGDLGSWSFYYYPMVVSENSLAAGFDNWRWIKELNGHGVPSWEGHSLPVYLMPVMKDNDVEYRNPGCPNAEKSGNESMVVIDQRLFLGERDDMEKLAMIISKIGKFV